MDSKLKMSAEFVIKKIKHYRKKIITFFIINIVIVIVFFAYIEGSLVGDMKDKADIPLGVWIALAVVAIWEIAYFIMVIWSNVALHSLVKSYCHQKLAMNRDEISKNTLVFHEINKLKTWANVLLIIAIVTIILGTFYIFYFIALLIYIGKYINSINMIEASLSKQNSSQDKTYHPETNQTPQQN